MNIRTYLDSLPRGGQSALAESLGISPAYLYQMSVGIRPVPSKLFRTIEAATKGAVTVYDLLPAASGPAAGIPPAPKRPSPEARHAA